MKRLLLLLPAGVLIALFMFALTINPVSELPSWMSLYLPPLFLGFAIQAAALRLTRKGFRWLRIVPLGLLALPAIALVEVVRTKEGFWPLGVVLCVEIALLYVMGWGAAWGLEDKDHA